MYHELMESICDRLVSCGAANPGQIKGCTTEEISKIQLIAGMRLPAAYESFLKVMGRGGGSFFRGTDIYYPNVLSIRREAELMLEDNSFRLEVADFVFSSHQGCQFMYFKLGVSEDPPINYYLDGEEDSKTIASSFTQYMTRCIEEHERLPEVARRSDPGF